ncbi:MAG: 16S rRNA (cytosine(967)-C(5))-methyltransferase RsmB [Lachnospiraceae bacterium]|nr:16S rRNA (cytosine(967)-C(5))-methyltransferase RsmB [Lachnospiraceae bacterium]
MNERERAYRALYKIFFENGLCHEVLRETLDEIDKSGEALNKAWLARLVNGTCERWLTFSFLIEKQSGRPVTKIKPQLQVILAMSLYQAFFMKVPESAAANEAVKLAKKHKLSGLSGFVNGVLRNIFRTAAGDFENYLGTLLKDEKSGKKLSVKYSVPEELLSVMEKELGKETLTKALSGFFTEKKLCFYRLSEKCSEEEFEDSLKKDGINYSKREEQGLENAYIIETAVSPTSVECFKNGLCIVQNISSVRACELLQVKGDEKAIDVCAAPGGKALHLADRLKNGTVIACDLTAAKTGKIEENIKRCGIKNIKTFAADATINIKEFNEAFDIVTADLPCSGLGVIGSKPDIRYKTSAADIAELAGIQKKILKNVSRYLVPGGMLSFSTCTFTKEENEDNAEYIKSLGFSEQKRLRILPDGEQDGFFVAIFKKNEQ